MLAEVSSPLDELAAGVADGLGRLVTALGSAWGALPRATLVTVSNGAASDLVTFIQSSLGFYAAGIAILAIMVGGARTAWERRAEPARATLAAVLRLVVVSGAGLLATGLLVIAADSLSGWILANVQPNGSLSTQLHDLIDPAAGSNQGSLLVVILGVFAIFVTSAQVMILVARGGALVVLAGVLPLSASFSSTEVGRNWFGRITAWILAFALYKPAAAIVLAVAFQLTGTNAIVGRGDSTGLVAALTGIVMLALSIAVLPALLRLLVPVSMAVARGEWNTTASLVGQVTPSGARQAALVVRQPIAAPRSLSPSGAGVTPEARREDADHTDYRELTSGD